jgi:hypothetical protein
VGEKLQRKRTAQGNHFVALMADDDDGLASLGRSNTVVLSPSGTAAPATPDKAGDGVAPAAWARLAMMGEWKSHQREVFKAWQLEACWLCTPHGHTHPHANPRARRSLPPLSPAVSRVKIFILSGGAQRGGVVALHTAD